MPSKGGGARMSATQIAPIGPHPSADVLLVGALLWSDPDAAVDVLRLVHDDDLADPPTAAVLAAVRSRADTGRPLGPQLVLDELRRIGQLRGSVPDRLRDATTCGAVAEQARDLAAAVVADSLRRRVESAGHALTTAAGMAAEADLAPMVAAAAAAVSDCAHRLQLLRGDSL